MAAARKPSLKFAQPPEDTPAEEPAGDASSESSSSPAGENKAKRGRPRKDAAASEIKSKVSSRTSRFADMLADRDPELASVLREDGPAMAECLAGLSSNRVAKQVVLTVLTVLEPIFAFGRLAQLFARRIEERSARLREELSNLGASVDEPGPPPAN